MAAAEVVAMVVFRVQKKKKNLLKNLICALLSQSGLQIHTVDTVHRHFLIR